jgi:hypothetical protein
MEQSNIAIFLHEEKDKNINWENMKQEAHLHLDLTSPCFSMCHSSPCNSALWKSNICLLEMHVLVLHLRINICLHISFQTPILYLLFVWWIN